MKRIFFVFFLHIYTAITFTSRASAGILSKISLVRYTKRGASNSSDSRMDNGQVEVCQLDILALKFWLFNNTQTQFQWAPFYVKNISAQNLPSKFKGCIRKHPKLNEKKKLSRKRRRQLSTCSDAYGSIFDYYSDHLIPKAADKYK